MICVNAERLERTIREMGRLGFSGESNGRTRLALSDADKQGRDLFCKWLHETGLEVRVDAIGNIFGVRWGGDGSAPPVMMGSHLDTVKDAGMFDGIAGVLGGLEVVRTLNEHDIKTERPIIVASFTNEEGARFEYDMMGSSFFTGAKTEEYLYAVADDDGLTVGEELRRIGYKGAESVPVGNYLEFHVEQGPILDAEGFKIGVVEGIQGVAWWRVEFTGQANHAGSTPMRLRRDALLGAAEAALEIEALAKRSESVGTIGRIRPEPDVVNIVPGKCTFTIDFRQYDPVLYEKAKKTIEDTIGAVAEKRGLTCKFEELVDAKPVVFDKAMVDIVEASAKTLGLSTRRLYSGAGHDAQFLAGICPTAMIFVPSVDGRSHCPEEWTDFQDIANGCNVLLQSVLKLAII